jgi:PTH1 family peptidyl-tRNA hydrolase
VTERRGTPADLLVMGLGNPGQEYSRSRHNVGAEVVEELARRHGGRLKKARQQRALTAEVSYGRARLALAVPTTYVNLSGDAASSLVRRHQVGLDQLVIVHDELDLPPAALRVKVGGGLAGHNGLRSIVAHLKSPDFVRVRIGVGKPPGGPTKGADHVLKRFSKAEREQMDVVQVAADAVEAIATDGLAAAMNDINGR